MNWRVFLYYYSKVLIYNLELTGIAAVILAGTGITLSGTTIKNIDIIVFQLSIIFPAAGTGISIFLYHFFKRYTYPFYYNCEFRVSQLIVYTIMLNTIITLFILVLYIFISRSFR